MDHLLFLILLGIYFEIEDWKQILLAITAFTVGHSLALALSVTGLLKLNSQVIEWVIPLTLIAAAINNIFKKSKHKNNTVNYFITLFFGLIHGMGFSNFLKSLLGAENEIFYPLLGFNIGIEVAQLLVFFVMFIVLTILINVFKLKSIEIRKVVSAWLGGYATLLAINAFPF